MDKNLIIQNAKEIIRVDINSIHGSSHWARVEKFGHYLAELNGADKRILSLFAYLHDLGRETDNEDVLHGERSAQIAKSFLEKGIFVATSKEMDKLLYACSHHHKLKAQSDDITIKTCWDADRLDMWRANIEPNPLYLYTPQAKNPEVIAMARLFSIGESDVMPIIY